MRALVCMHFPGLILATQVQVLGYFIKAQIWLGLRFAPIPGLSSSGDQVLGMPSCSQLKAVAYPLTHPSHINKLKNENHMICPSTLTN